jgi:hypothetical protein
LRCHEQSLCVGCHFETFAQKGIKTTTATTTTTTTTTTTPQQQQQQNNTLILPTR